VRIFSYLTILLFVFTCVCLDGTAVQAASIGSGVVTPQANATVKGVVEITGIAQHDTFRKWQLDLLLDGDENQTTFLAVGEQRLSEAGLLSTLDTTLYPDGHHRLRLRVVHSNLNYDEYFTSITINNNRTLVPAVVDVAAEPEPLQPVLAGPLGEGVPEGRRWIEVDLSDQTLTAWQGESVVLHTLISSGRTQYPTVRGTYQVRTKLPLERMIGPGYDTPNVPWTMYFYRGYAIHGAYWHNNFGTPVSHGCVNMRVDEAKALYDWASFDTEIVVHD